MQKNMNHFQQQQQLHQQQLAAMYESMGMQPPQQPQQPQLHHPRMPQQVPTQQSFPGYPGIPNASSQHGPPPQGWTTAAGPPQPPQPGGPTVPGDPFSSGGPGLGGRPRYPVRQGMVRPPQGIALNAAAAAASGSSAIHHPYPQLSTRPPVIPSATAATQLPTQQQQQQNIDAIRANSETHKKHLKQYAYRDEQYQDTLNYQHKRHMALAHEKKREIEAMQMERRSRMRAGPASVFGPGYSGCGNAPTGLETRILYPNDRRRPRRSKEIRFRLDQLIEQGKKEDKLVPIRLEIEIDGYKLRDTFTWNMNETLITPDQFAEIMCEDLQLPTAQFAPLIARGIKDQVEDYYLHAGSTVLEEDGSDNGRDYISLLEDSKVGKELPVVKQESVEVEDASKSKRRRNPELRMLIKLDITVGNRALLDQFEWDIACPRNNAEEFAEKLTNELGLGGEFRTAIAHSIREQAHSYVKSLILVGHEFNGSPILDDDLRQSFLPALRSSIRDNDIVERFTPAILELTDAEIDKIEKDRMREARRKRRQARGRRGIVLPDREPLKTFRTGVAVPPDQDGGDDTYLVNVGMINGSSGGHNTRGSTPTYEPMHSQRRSALKARMNIAADAASNHHMNPSSPSPYQQGLQGVISLNAGNRFSTMTDHTTRQTR
ncbi:hypothetical protein BDA99DRAFT_462505 [Phascolomyces articulosus]|uniref:Uncharacterized protein n=1 Tax=Phascolomyces articulosus TaxID=60185 RepID=A0AAD5K1J8_9FUNG|nr:hypothetical protein BDA99DRAFT_462505 [Phascolomyces articulosus]